jgi:hypothetical protein
MMTLMRRLITGPSPDELAARELDAAKRALLQAQSAQEYARSMVIYNQQRIARLRAYLADQEGDEGNPSFG